MCTKYYQCLSGTCWGDRVVIGKLEICDRDRMAICWGLTRVVFQKGGFGGCPPRTRTGTRARRVPSDVPPERKPERGYVRMFPQNENRNEGTFAKTTLLRNRPFNKLSPSEFGHPKTALSAGFLAIEVSVIGHGC